MRLTKIVHQWGFLKTVDPQNRFKQQTWSIIGWFGDTPFYLHMGLQEWKVPQIQATSHRKVRGQQESCNWWRNRSIGWPQPHVCWRSCLMGSEADVHRTAVLLCKLAWHHASSNSSCQATCFTRTRFVSGSCWTCKNIACWVISSRRSWSITQTRSITGCQNVRCYKEHFRCLLQAWACALHRLWSAWCSDEYTGCRWSGVQWGQSGK